MNLNPIITQTSIAAGPQGTRETLRIMAGLSRNASRWELFRDFSRMFTNASEVDSVLRPFYRYANEDVETLYAPEYNLTHLIKTGSLTGDCDDIATFYGAIFYVLGIPARFVAMRTRQYDPDYYHVVVEALEADRWKRFDATVIPGLVQVDYGQMWEYI